MFNLHANILCIKVCNEKSDSSCFSQTRKQFLLVVTFMPWHVQFFLYFASNASIPVLSIDLFDTWILEYVFYLWEPPYIYSHTMVDNKMCEWQCIHILLLSQVLSSVYINSLFSCQYQVLIFFLFYACFCWIFLLFFFTSQP